MFKLNSYHQALLAASLGLSVLSVPYHSSAFAQGTPNSTQQERPNQQQLPTNVPGSNRPSPQNPNQTNNDRQDDDRVYISDIYPEYCRSYFLRRDYVSLNEYRAGMYRCKYGNDRWSF